MAFLGEGEGGKISLSGKRMCEIYGAEHLLRLFGKSKITASVSFRLHPFPVAHSVGIGLTVICSAFSATVNSSHLILKLNGNLNLNFNLNGIPALKMNYCVICYVSWAVKLPSVLAHTDLDENNCKVRTDRV